MEYLSLIISILTVVATWMVFEKAGQAGWKAIIPFYDRYTECQIINKKSYFIPWLIAAIINITTCIIFFISMIFSILTYSMVNSANDFLLNSSIYPLFLGLIILVSLIVCTVYNILIRIEEAKVFSLPTGFAVGLIFLPCIFLCIMAFNPEIKYNQILNIDKNS